MPTDPSFTNRGTAENHVDKSWFHRFCSDKSNRIPQKIKGSERELEKEDGHIRKIIWTIFKL